MAKKKILIITSYVTGHGHKSVTNAIEDEIALRDDLEVKSIEGFSLAGQMGVKIGSLYAPIIRTSKDMWRFIYEVTCKRPGAVKTLVKRLIKRKFNKIVDEYKPDLILTTHPTFTSAIIDLLREKKRKIPFAILFTDFISISPVWIDHRAQLTIAPTDMAKSFAERSGVSEDKIKIISLPVRSNILNAARTIDKIDEEAIRNKKEVDFLVMSGGDGSGNLGGIVERLLKIENSRISVVTGRNTKLKEILDKRFDSFRDRVTIYGFVTDIENLLITHDIGITKAGANAVIEAVNCCLPIIVAEMLPGQEEGNVDFLLRNNCGLYCNKNTSITKLVNKLLKDDKKRLIEIKKAQFELRDLDAAKKVVNELVNIMRKGK